METRDKIIDVANEQFIHLGVRYVTMDDIARAAGVSKKTIYQEFDDKGRLVYESFKRSMDRDKAFFEDLHKEASCPIEHFVLVSKYIRTRFSKINPLVFGEVQRYYPESWRLFQDFKNNCAVRTITEVINNGKERGYFRSEINADILAMIRMDQISGIFDPSRFSPSEYNILDVQMAVMDHFIHGILTDKGRELFYKINNQD
ncbi:TetR/AcrR family transcriptional regulator [Echinicola shivajiensis]|uniref:TetR/AcrR family transcriptional regulator n=1 Tax=Echinicola shivajiensis TaxID=1035916 RepID=UPI001BFCA1C2|nr:TetR/AcrR family transcriptional regulator [Echinicola shivajiensis]